MDFGGQSNNGTSGAEIAAYVSGLIVRGDLLAPCRRLSHGAAAIACCHPCPSSSLAVFNPCCHPLPSPLLVAVLAVLAVLLQSLLSSLAVLATPLAVFVAVSLAVLATRAVLDPLAVLLRALFACLSLVFFLLFLVPVFHGIRRL
eukprot:COSAG02_NODE_13_length_57813_cov_14.298276_24_plen_145_part_00